MTTSERLFFALRPDRDVRERLARLADECVSRRGGRPVAPANLHITLAFLGQTTPDARVQAETIAAAIRGRPFSLALDRIGHWPRPRVVWSAPSVAPETLGELMASLLSGLGDAGFRLDARPFHPHLTLACKVSTHFEAFSHPPVRWRIGDFCLIRSETLPDGVCYRVVGRWPLDAG